MELRVNANALITNPEGKVLVIKLKKGIFNGKCSFPGGGIDPGELSHETIKREILEETGIVLKNDIKPFGFCELIHNPFESHRIELLLYSEAEGEPKETTESENDSELSTELKTIEGIAKWMSYEEAEPTLIPFAKETYRIWKEKKRYFTLINE